MPRDPLYELEMARAQLTNARRQACPNPLVVETFEKAVRYWQAVVEEEIRPELDSVTGPV